MKFTMLHIPRSGSSCLNGFFLELGIKMTGFEVSHPSSPYRQDFDTYSVTECLDRLFREWDALRHNCGPCSVFMKEVKTVIWSLSGPGLSLIHDIDDTRKAKYGVYYTQKSPLNLAQWPKKEPGI